MNKKTVGLVIATFLIGGGIGAVSSIGTSSAVKPVVKTVVKTVTVPGPVVTKTVKVPGPERIVTKTIEVKVPGPATNTTPDACLKALDLADEGFGYAGDGFEAAADALTAVSTLDVDGINAATEKLNTAGEGVGAISADYNTAKAACRS